MDSDSVQIYAKQIVLESLAVVDLHSKILDAPPPGVQILSISCSFWENLGCSQPGVHIKVTKMCFTLAKWTRLTGIDSRQSVVGYVMYR